LDISRALSVRFGISPAKRPDAEVISGAGFSPNSRNPPKTSRVIGRNVLPQRVRSSNINTRLIPGPEGEGASVVCRKSGNDGGGR